LVVIDAKGSHDGLAQAWSPPTRPPCPTPGCGCSPRSGWASGAATTGHRQPAGRGVRLDGRILLVPRGRPGCVADGRGPARPPIRSGRELVRRLDPAALQRAWEHDPEILGLARSMDKKGQLTDVHIRVTNLVAALTGALDGEVSWEDADCWSSPSPPWSPRGMRTAPSGDCCRIAAISRWSGRRPVSVAADGGRVLRHRGWPPLGDRLLERGRGARAGVVLAGQSAVALGSEEERARLLAAASAILLFRTPQPSELAALAGTERVAEGPGRSTARS
jgi:hypothetical protein